jgi:hypothetical protein
MSVLALPYVLSCPKSIFIPQIASSDRFKFAAFIKSSKKFGKNEIFNISSAKERKDFLTKCIWILTPEK